VRLARRPTVPSQWEKERHEVTHVPFRSWCPAVRGVRAPHKTRKRGESELPRFSFYYGFLGQEDEASAVILVMRELLSGMMFAVVVPRKCVGEAWVEQRLANWITGLGYKKLPLRCDNENGIL
jgi:hypothetical protein